MMRVLGGAMLALALISSGGCRKGPVPRSTPPPGTQAAPERTPGTQAPSTEAKPRISVERAADGSIAVSVGGALFTRLVAGEKVQKPYLYPVLLDGVPLTRHYPQEDAPGEDRDHPHHQSFWFTHGDVNGVDFWSVGSKAGRIVQTRVLAAEGGNEFARIATANEWITPAGEKLLDDERELRFYDLGKEGRAIDFSSTLTAAAGTVTFGDTKEGSFGIRLAESMKEKRGGKIVNSRGQTGMAQAWGKPAEWVDYTGQVEGHTVGVAIFDHPSSFRHPTTWHVRDYGLFAANPFGLKDFTQGKEDGTHKIAKGESIRFRYRVYLHPGTTEEARVAAAYEAFAHPPPAGAAAAR